MGLSEKVQMWDSALHHAQRKAAKAFIMVESLGFGLCVASPSHEFFFLKYIPVSIYMKGIRSTLEVLKYSVSAHHWQ